MAHTTEMMLSGGQLKHVLRDLRAAGYIMKYRKERGLYLIEVPDPVAERIIKRHLERRPGKKRQGRPWRDIQRAIDFWQLPIVLFLAVPASLIHVPLGIGMVIMSLAYLLLMRLTDGQMELMESFGPVFQSVQRLQWAACFVVLLAGQSVALWFGYMIRTGHIDRLRQIRDSLPDPAIVFPAIGVVILVCVIVLVALQRTSGAK